MICRTPSIAGIADKIGEVVIDCVLLLLFVSFQLTQIRKRWTILTQSSLLYARSRQGIRLPDCSRQKRMPQCSLRVASERTIFLRFVPELRKLVPAYIYLPPIRRAKW